MNEVVFGTGFGVLLGPHVLDIFDPRSWTGITDTLTREVMRIVLATGLFAIGVELPKRYMAEHAKGLLIMVVPTMAFGWVVSAGERSGWRAYEIERSIRPDSFHSSLHPCPFPQIRLCVVTCYLCVLDAHRSRRQCCCHRSVGTQY